MTKYGELNKLKGKITEEKQTYRSMSKLTGISLNSFCNKINGKSLFDITEVMSICSVLHITPADIPLYFNPKKFTHNVA